MEHRMNLQSSPFLAIKNGEKTIELRLYDEKRQKIRPGDTICFHHAEDAGQSILTKVLALYVFDSFEELYAELPLLECGYTQETVGSAFPKDMEVYYPPEKQKQFGVVGIRIALI